MAHFHFCFFHFGDAPPLAMWHPYSPFGIYCPPSSESAVRTYPLPGNCYPNFLQTQHLPETPFWSNGSYCARGITSLTIPLNMPLLCTMPTRKAAPAATIPGLFSNGPPLENHSSPCPGIGVPPEPPSCPVCA